MGSFYQPSRQFYMHNRTLRSVNIPPRKLRLSGQTSNMHHVNTNDDSFDEEVDLYSSEHFRMYDFKIRNCSRHRSHDWKECPFAHPGEKARRRDPKRHNYSSHVCPEFRRGGRCSKGDGCEYSHGVFETWLHPTRYRTEECKDGTKCLRKICFFAHTRRQLRDIPELTPTTLLNGRSYDYPPPPVPVNIIKKNALNELNKVSNDGESMSFNANDRGKRIVVTDPPKFNRAPGAPSTSRSNPFVEEKYKNDDGFGGPDFGWVNDLLT